MGAESFNSKPEPGRTPLTRDTIVDAAIELLDEVGLAKLSTRRLAGRLGIQNASLYWHFKNKDALLDAMSARLYNAVVPPPQVHAPDFDWAEWLAEGARAIHRVALSKRDGARIMLRIRLDDPDALRRIARNTAVLQEKGFTELEAQYALQTLRRFALGSALQEQQNLGLAVDTPGLAGEDVFEFGLRLVIDSLRRHPEAQTIAAPQP